MINKLLNKASFFKGALILFILLLNISCSKKIENKVIDNDNATLIKGNIEHTPIYNEPNENEFINEKFPKSKLMLNSKVIFTKSYVPLYVASNVKDIGFSDSLVYLTNNLIKIYNNACSSLLVEDYFEQIQVVENFILAYGKGKMILFDKNKCGSILEGTMKYENVKLLPPYLIFYENNIYSINIIGEYNTYFEGKTKNKIMDVGGTKEFLSLITDKGKLITLDLVNKEIIYSGDIGVNFTNWKFSKYTLFGITDKKYFTSVTTTFDGKKFLIHRDFSKDISIYKKCSLAKNTVALNCDNDLILKKETLPLDKHYDKFILLRKLFYGINNNELFQVLIDKKRYIKKVDINTAPLKACLNNETIYFTDLDGKIRKTKIGSKDIDETDSFPICENMLKFKNGYIKDDNQNLYDFAKKVKEGKNISLYKRIIGDYIYYFYSK